MVKVMAMVAAVVFPVVFFVVVFVYQGSKRIWLGKRQILNKKYSSVHGDQLTIKYKGQH